MIPENVSGAVSSTLSNSLQSLRTTVNNIYTNAPLLRYINSNSRYNRLPTETNDNSSSSSLPSNNTTSNNLPTDPSRVRTMNGHVVYVGAGNDGVFSNLSAKPSTAPPSAPDVLPSYNEASYDPSPPYWETSVMSEFDEIYIDGIPVGNIFNFLWSTMICVLFQFLGFIITYLLHTSHAAKNGAQLGLGVTIINLAFSALPIDINKTEIDSSENRFEPLDPAFIDVSIMNDDLDATMDNYQSSLSSHPDFHQSSNSGNIGHGTPLLAYSLFALGVFIIIKAIYDFIKVKRLEYSIMFPNTGPNSNRNDEEANVASIPMGDFGLVPIYEEEGEGEEADESHDDEDHFHETSDEDVD